MGHTRKRHYDRYTLAYKQQAVKLASHPDVMAKDVAESLGLHPVMLYRWCMEHRRGELKENKHMKPAKPSPRRKAKRADPRVENDAELIKAQKRIQQLEKALRNRDEELELLKKARRFFESKKQ
jgi:transposase